MADTIVNTPAARRGDTVDTTDSAVGWVIAAIVLVAIIVGGVILLRNAGGGASTVPGTNIDVSLPAGTGAGGASGGTGGAGGMTQ